MRAVAPLVFLAALAACSDSSREVVRGRWTLDGGAGSIEFETEKVTVRSAQAGSTEYVYEIAGEDDGWILLIWRDRDGERTDVRVKRAGKELTVEHMYGVWLYRRES